MDRETILWGLDEPPTDALAELRGVLVREHEWRVREGLAQSDTVATMRIAGVRLGAPVARLLSEILVSEGHPETAGKIADAIAQKITIEAPLTLEDYEAIADALSRNCPAALYRLRTELLEELRRLRRITSSQKRSPRECESRELVALQCIAQGRGDLSSDRRCVMHAVVVKVSITDSDAAQQALEGQVVPRVKQAPGFVAGYWTRSDDRSNGQGMIVFESEEAARAAAEQLRANVPDPVTLESAEVREVVANAQPVTSGLLLVEHEWRVREGLV